MDSDCPICLFCGSCLNSREDPKRVVKKVSSGGRAREARVFANSALSPPPLAFRTFPPYNRVVKALLRLLTS